jgi:hypothetical protein
MLETFFAKLMSYKGAVFAFVIMFVVMETTSRKDVVLRLFIIATMTQEVEKFVAYLFGWGDDFQVIYQVLGVFGLWVFVGILKCVFLKKCRQSLLETSLKFVKAWSKK